MTEPVIPGVIDESSRLTRGTEVPAGLCGGVEPVSGLCPDVSVER